MKVLVVGASGATGRLLVEQLLSHNIHVNAIVRSTDALSNGRSCKRLRWGYLLLRP